MGILNDVKKVLGLPSEYDAFDLDVLMHINTAMSTLHQLGIGPDEGFMIEDDTAEWVDLLGDDPRQNQARTYVCLRTRMLFDPPTTSYLISAMERQITEMEWRMNIVREGDLHPLEVPVEEETP